MKLTSRLALLLLLAGMLPVSRASYARQAAPEAPHLVYSSYIGTSNFDGVADVAVAPDGSIVIAVVSLPDSTVMRFNADGKTVLGQRKIKGGAVRALALGRDGAIYAVGQASAQAGLETVRPFQASANGELQGFVAKVSGDAKQLLFCSYLGGSRSDGFTDDSANDVAVDGDGMMYVVGTTQGSNDDFPVANATQATYGGGYTDGFVSIIDPSTSTLLFSTYMGGSDDDELKSCALDSESGKLYVAGGIAPNFDGKTADPQPPPCAGNLILLAQYIKGEALTQWELKKIRERCKKGRYFDELVRLLDYATGTPVGDQRIVVVDSDINIEDDKLSRLGRTDIQLLVYDADLNELNSGAFGGEGDDYPGGLATDSRGILYVIGESDGVGLPAIHAFQPTYGGGGSDVFVAAFDLATLQPVYSSYIGGSKDDYPNSIALDAEGNILLAGFTDSANFPLTADAAQPHIAALTDGFLAKVSALGDLVPDFGITVDPPTLTVARGASGTLTVNVGRSGAFAGRVTVTAPDTKALKVKLTPGSATTADDTVTFKYKVKKKAPLGTYDLVFTGRDADERTRSATLRLSVE